MTKVKPVLRAQPPVFVRKDVELSANDSPNSFGNALIVYKGIAVLALLSLSFSAFSATQAASIYDCVGTGVTVNYSTSSFVGLPSMTVTKNSRVFAAGGQGITIEPTVLGSLVMIVKSTIPDLETQTFTLVVPDVNANVIDQVPKVKFLTELFSTTSRTTIGGPALVTGVVQISISQPLFYSAVFGAF